MNNPNNPSPSNPPLQNNTFYSSNSNIKSKTPPLANHSNYNNNIIPTQNHEKNVTDTYTQNNTLSKDKILALLSKYDPALAELNIILGEFLLRHNMGKNLTDALILAYDFIILENENTRKTLITLLKDGWHDSLPQLLKTARDL